jgi:hypothetical protein
MCRAELDRREEPQPLNCVAQRTIIRQIRSRQEYALDDVDQAEQLVSFYRATYHGRDIGKVRRYFLKVVF